MPNHFHLLYTAPDGCRPVDTPSSNRQLLTRGIAITLSSYTQGLNKQLNRTGALFQAKTKAILLPDTSGTYPRTCLHYIHQNPVRARLAASLEQWPYSSYRDYAGLRNGTLCNQPVAHQLLDVPTTPELFVLESAQGIPVEYVAGWL